MFSDISKIFDRAFLTASFLPAAFFCAIQALLLTYIGPQEIPFYRELRSLSTAGKASAFIIAVTVIAVLLQLLNRPLIRLLEGYPIRTWSRPRRQKDKFERQSKVIKKYENGTEEYRSMPDNKALYNRIARTFPVDFPGEASLVLPTQLVESQGVCK